MTIGKFHVVGKRFPMKDGVSKVTGSEKYASDIALSNMLHAKVLRSPYPHAKVKSIDLKAAEKMGAICITFEDTPKKMYCPFFPKETVKDTKVLTEKPLYVGDAIAAIAADTEREAEKALKLVKAEYLVLEPIFDPVESMRPSKSALHDFVIIKNKKTRIKNNMATKVELSIGDIEKGFNEADVIIENEYKTGRPYHAQLETKSVVCQPEPNGGIIVWATTQSIHGTRILLSEIFGIPLSKVNVIKLSIGGSFGSSLHLNSIIPICVALALKAQRPVKLVSTREEDMHDHCRHSSTTRYKLGAKRDGTLVAGRMEVVIDCGAYNTQAQAILTAMPGMWANHYKLPNLRFEGISVYVNKVPARAMIGWGNPQVNFVVESQIDDLAEKLHMDPIELKLKNHVGLGDMYHLGAEVMVQIKSCGMEEILTKGAELIGWKNRPNRGEQKGYIRRGIGISIGENVSGVGAPLPIRMDYSSAMIKINEDGTVDLVTPLMDHGGGTVTACAKIVAEELGVPLSNVSISPADTSTTPYDVATHASRGVYVGGLTAKKVASQVRDKLLEYASRIIGAPPDALNIKPNDEIRQGLVYVEGTKGKEVTIREVAETARQKNWGTIASVDSYQPLNRPPSYLGCFMEVEVNIRNGHVKPLRAIIGCDAGTIINPRLAEGQLHGGLNKGIGYALIEDTEYNKKTGEMLNKGYLTDFKMLTASDLPSLKNIEVFFTDTYEPDGPLGAKGISEVGINPIAAAVTNAVYNAIGIRFRDIPITPEKVLEALKEKEMI